MLVAQEMQLEHTNTNMSEAHDSGQYLHTGKWETIMALDAETGRKKITQQWLIIN
jgi:hypothetical protein